MALDTADLEVPAPSALNEAANSLCARGFVSFNVVPFLSNRRHLARFLCHWDNLVQDPYLPPNFGLRFRRHARFRFEANRRSFVMLPTGPYFQSANVNPVMGGVMRKFAALEQEAVDDPVLSEILKCGTNVFPLDEWKTWILNVHFIRIPTSAAVSGCPCPEGIHNDGFEFISIHFMQSRNIVGAETSLFDNDHNLLAEVRLEKTLDSIFAFDKRILHYTDNFVSRDRSQGFRDTLLVSYERETGL
jgi:hypothetical protein